MKLLIINFFSPVLMLIVAIIFVWVAKFCNIQKANTKYLNDISFKYAAIGAGSTLLLTVIWMVWYQITTGYDPGNAPVGWIFVYGPTSSSIGQLVALIRWWFKKPIE